jgi:PTS system nitrogen regulatory IIA component
VADENEVMTSSQVADYLQLAEKTVVRMAQRGELPAAKVASQWRFLRPVIRDWLAGQMESLAATELPVVPEYADGLLPLREVVRPEFVSLDVAPGSKEAVLRQLIQPLVEAGFLTEGQRFLGALIDRERMMSTAIGHGVALPHPRAPLAGLFEAPAVAVGVCRAGTDFDAVDDQRVHVFFVICATRDEVHLRLMAKVAWLVRHGDLAARLRTADSREGIVRLLSRKAPAL